MDLEEVLPEVGRANALIDSSNLRENSERLLRYAMAVVLVRDLAGLFPGSRLERRPDRAREHTAGARPDKLARRAIGFTCAAIGQANRNVDGGQSPWLSRKLIRSENLRRE